MTASLRLRAGPRGPVVDEMRSSGPVAFRPTEWGVWTVSTEAHPIGGDRILARVAVGRGCHATLRSVSATVARRGRGESLVAVAVRVAEGGSLAWNPEPGVAAAGAVHLSDVRIRLAAETRLVWKDEWVLGRFGEDPGSWRSRVRIVYDGRPVLTSDLATGPAAAAWPSPGVLAGAGAVSSIVMIDPEEAFDARRVSCGSALGVCLPLHGPGVQIIAWGEDLGDCRKAVDELSQPRLFLRSGR